MPLAPVMRKMLLALSPAMAARMVGQVANLNTWIDDSCLDGLPLTTSCSGTDLILPVLNLFFLIATLMMGVPLIQPRHLWSCESDSQKAAWITQVMGIGRIFADVGDLSSGLAKEHFTSLMGQVSSGLIHACGFNCQSVSGLNKQRKMFNRCIRKRKGKTGVSWWGTFSYVRRFLPLFVWLENVSTLRGDNLADVLSLLRMIGYIVVHFVLDHCHHGVPGHRNRLWIIAKLAPLASIADQEFAQMQASQLELALRQDPEPLSAFLDPAEDDMHAPQKRRQAPRAKAKSKSKCKAKAKAKVLAYKAKHDAVWGGERPAELPALFEGVKDFLTDRELDVALYDYVMREDEYEEGCTRFLDVSQSIDRCPRFNDMLPTITPAGRFLMINTSGEEARPVRLVRAFECMRTQGFDGRTMLSDEQYQHMDAYCQKTLQNMAGNAFSGFHIAAVALLSLVLFDIPTTVSELEELRAEA